jgi:hypothetical protein
VFSAAHTVRLSAILAGLSIAASSLCAAASAAPTITSFRTMALPIPGYPGTGDILGAGAIVEGEAAISGSEYGGAPLPLIGIEVYAPVGLGLHPRGFASCPAETLEKDGPGACPKRSTAGPRGSATGVVSFGGERVGETASVQPFFAPAGNLEAFVDGSTPVSLEIVAKARFVGSAPPYGPQFTGEVPLIETVPGALDASFVRGTVEVGAAYRQGKRVVSYLTLPKTCPPGGWPVKLEMIFLGGATAEASYRMPCARR